MISSWFATWFARWMIASILRVPGGAMPRPTQTEHQPPLLPSDLIWKQLTENVWRKEAGDLYGEIKGFCKKKINNNNNKTAGGQSRNKQRREHAYF